MQVWLDGESKNSLGRANDCNMLHRWWIQRNLSAMYQLFGYVFDRKYRDRSLNSNACIAVDTYGLYAASAVSANTVLRSLMACGLPLAVK